MAISLEEMESRTVRYCDLIACTTAFIDARTPGSDLKENFCIIGPGVAENPGQHVHVKIAHGFNIGAARQPKGCTNSQHSHDTAEVFLVHSGDWAFRWGHDGKDGEVILKPGDVVSFPTNLFRGFEPISDGENFLFAILGGDDPGHVVWAPYVFEEAKHHGLVLTQSGRLIDTKLGGVIPNGDTSYVPVNEEELKSFRSMTSSEMDKFIVRAGELSTKEKTNLSSHSTGVEEIPVLGPENNVENIGPAKVDHPHGFQFRKLCFDKHGQIPRHARDEEEVVFIHDGAVIMSWEDDTIILRKGDTITVPKEVVRSWQTIDGASASLFVVRGSDAPQAPMWENEPAIRKKQSGLKLVS